jgi:endonuclease/exonuclease/phosphatase family metal-dependent hydrolase
MLVAAALLGAGALALAAADHRTLPAAEGTILHGTTFGSGGQGAVSPTRKTLRVASFNIHSGRNARGEFDLARTAELLDGFDLVGLNEVRGAYDWQAGDQAELLGRRLDMPWLFAPTTHRWLREDFGNGVLCSLPVRQWQRMPLAGTRGKGHRNYVRLTIEHGDRDISVLVTHLDRVQDRAAQLTDVIEHFLSLPEPAILMGDLNTTANDPELAALLAHEGVHDVVAEGMATQPTKRIDWILSRGLRGVAGGVAPNQASDHPLVWAELELIDTQSPR